jgi:hypothetical protein
MTYSSKICLPSTSFTSASARLSVLPLDKPLPRAPHLIAPERANTGDFIGVSGGIVHRPDLGHAPVILSEVAFRKGVINLENFYIDEMSNADAAVFKEITAVPFGGFDHHLIARQAQMVAEGRPYQIYLFQFSDAILYVHPSWLQGTWGHEPCHATMRPLMMMLEGARSMEDAERSFEKTKRLMKVFRSALPPKVRVSRNRGLELPRADDFFATGDASHAFVR